MPAPSRRRWLVAGLLGCVVALVVVVTLSLTIGTRPVGLSTVVDALLARTPRDTDQMVVLDLRVPRTVIGLVAGGALGLAGTLMQGLTRNPLADPGLLGVNAGASLFVVVAITWLGVSSATGYVWFAIAGAAVATLVVYLVGSGRNGPTPVTLTLAGAAVTAALTSVITVILLGNLDTLNQYRFWSVGSLVGRSLTTVGQVAPVLIVGAVIALALGRSLNVLSLGDDVARGLGQRIAVTRVLAAVSIVILCGGATAIAGPIVFVGLVVPHLVRRFTGPDYRWILAFSVVVGPILLVLADIIGRVVVQPAELEAGLVVAIVGAPVMIALVRSGRGATL